MGKLLGAKIQHTTAFHPQSNGLIERLHRTLKAALISHEDTQWTKSLATVLLGLRAAFKESINASSAELVYGQELQLPGQFFKQPQEDVNNTGEFLTSLKYCMSQLQPVKQMCQSQKQIFVHKDLELSTHVWVRRENGRSLESKYVGPYQVIEKNPKYFKIRIGSKEDMVSIDRLKPAYSIINNLSTVCYENACNSNIHCKSVSFITRKEVM